MTGGPQLPTYLEGLLKDPNHLLQSLNTYFKVLTVRVVQMILCPAICLRRICTQPNLALVTFQARHRAAVDAVAASPTILVRAFPATIHIKAQTITSSGLVERKSLEVIFARLVRVHHSRPMPTFERDSELVDGQLTHWYTEFSK